MEEGLSYACIGYAIQYTSLFNPIDVFFVDPSDEVFFPCSRAARLSDNATGLRDASGNGSREETAIDN